MIIIYNMQMITEIMWNNTIKHNQGRWFWLNKDKRWIYKMIEVIIMTLKKANDCDNDQIDNDNNHWNNCSFKGDLRTICRFSYMKVYKLITLGTKFKTLLSLGRKITMFSKFITNYIEQGWWHSSLTLKCMHFLLKEVNKRGRHAYNLHGWTCLPSGIVMEIHCHITGIF